MNLDPLKTRDSDQAAGKMRELFQQGHVPRVLHADGEFTNIELGIQYLKKGPSLMRSLEVELQRPGLCGGKEQLTEHPNLFL
jgi:hypothetical protein